MTRRILLIIILIIPCRVYSQNIDIRLLRYFNSPESLPSDKVFQFFSNSEPYLIAVVPVTLSITGLIRHDETMFHKSCVAAAAVIVNSGVTLALKYSVNRTRPFITYPDIVRKSHAGSPSFPSGHTSSAFALATSLSLSYPKWYVIAPVYTWAGTVAFSRMDLGVHYPSDVLAGAAIGAGSAWLTHIVNKKLSRKPWEKPCDCPKF